MSEKNIELEIVKLNNTGEGIGYYEKRTVFVPFCFPGETVEAAIDPASKGKLLWGKLNKVLKEHPARTSKEIPLSGAPWQNLKYEQQLLFKEQALKEALSYFGKLDLEKTLVKPIVPSENTSSYRNKITLTFHQNGLGMFEKGSHKIIKAADLPLIPEKIKKLIACLDAYFSDKHNYFYTPGDDSGDLRQLVLKWNTKYQILAGLVTRKKPIPLKEDLASFFSKLKKQGYDVLGLIQNINKVPKKNIMGAKSRLVWGEENLLEEIGNYSYKQDLPSFSQVNLEIAEKIQKIIAAELKADDAGLLFDLFGGNGFLSMAQYKKYAEIYIVEGAPSAIKLATENYALNNIENIRCFEGKVEEFLKSNTLFPAAVILDPPRTGCSKEILDKLKVLNPKQLIYLSCAPVTLARDLKELIADNTFKIKEIIPFDMFPQTPHLETLVILENGI
jgi:23S rRNA (uracil1939-C5)-methyltransferase